MEPFDFAVNVCIYRKFMSMIYHYLPMPSVSHNHSRELTNRFSPSYSSSLSTALPISWFHFISSILRLRLLTILLLSKLQTDTVNTMPLIGRRIVSLSLEHMSQMSSTITAHNLRPLHAECAICVSRHRTWYCIKESRPSASALELLICGVESCSAAGASVRALLWIVFVVVTGEWRLGAFLSEDAELL